VRFEDLQEAFSGSALGCAAGDALGREVEGWSHEAIRRHFGLLTEMQDGRYTDDTEMMIGLMEALLEDREFDPARAAKRFLENFHPWRGYGARIYGVMARLKQGLPWQEVGTDSWGNGAAMRVAPIGFFFFDDRGRLKEKAILSATITHKHPEGVAGAVAQALAVGMVTERRLQGQEIDPVGFVREVSKEVEGISPEVAEELRKIEELPHAEDVLEGARLLSSSFGCDISAKGAVPAAIGAFVLGRGFREAVLMAVNAGGDTDTLGAMAGAIAGAYYGLRAIPEGWLLGLEDEGKGKSYILHLAEELARIKAEG